MAKKTKKNRYLSKKIELNGNDRLWVEARIYKKKRYMEKHYYHKTIKFSKVDAFFDYKPITVLQKNEQIGTIYFYKNRISAGLIAHECMHAALYYFELINHNKTVKIKTNEDNEFMAEIMGWLVDSIMSACTKKKAKTQLLKVPKRLFNKKPVQEKD